MGNLGGWEREGETKGKMQENGKLGAKGLCWRFLMLFRKRLGRRLGLKRERI